MSVILRPEQLEGSVLYTVAAAVAARRAIAEYSPDAKIKWVNDVYVKDLKVSGILCEAVSELESGKLEAVICGIGINLTAPEGGFALDIRHLYLHRAFLGVAYGHEEEPLSSRQDT